MCSSDLHCHLTATSLSAHGGSWLIDIHVNRSASNICTSKIGLCASQLWLSHSKSSLVNGLDFRQPEAVPTAIISRFDVKLA